MTASCAPATPEQQIEADEKLTYSLKECARKVGIGYSTFRLDVAAEKCVPGKRKRVTKEELLRYVRNEYGPQNKVGRPAGPSNVLTGEAVRLTRVLKPRS